MPRIALFLFFTTATLLSAFANDAAARVKSISGGSASLVRSDANGEDSPQGSLTTGQTLSTGDKVVTGTGCSVVLQLRDGTTLEIAEESHLVIGEESIDGGKKRIFSLQFGNLLAKVKKLASSDENFVIVTPTSIAGVRGTAFSVSVGEDGASHVGVSEGSVAVQSELSEKETPTLINPNEAVETSATGAENKKKFDPAKFQFKAWRDGNREILNKNFAARAEKMAERFKNNALQMAKAQEDLRETIKKLHKASLVYENAKKRRERRLVDEAEKEEVALLRRYLNDHHHLHILFERISSFHPVFNRMRGFANGHTEFLEKMQAVTARNKEIREKLNENHRGMLAFFNQENKFILHRLELHSLLARVK